jgi:hypothetical protein
MPMIPTHIKWPAAIFAGVLVSLLHVSGAPAAEPTPDLRLCAARDLDVVMLIEDYGATNAVAPDRLAKAALIQVEARNACSAGNTDEAIALYEEIIRSLGTVVSDRPQ